MLVLKKHIHSAINKNLSESLNSEKETDLSVDYFSLDTDAGIRLYRDDSSLSFNFPEQAVCQTGFSGALQCPLRHLLSFVISK